MTECSACTLYPDTNKLNPMCVNTTDYKLKIKQGDEAFINASPQLITDSLVVFHENNLFSNKMFKSLK